jgi:hypothetical protein
MAVLNSDDIADLVALTQRELGKFKWTEIATDTASHVAFNELMRRKRRQITSGYGVEFSVMVKHSGAARRTGLFSTDSLNVQDVFVRASIPWSHWTSGWALDVREVLMNRDPARILDLAKGRRADAMISLAELVETDFWSKPATSATDDQVYGVDYWLVYSATSGFNGGTPSGFSDVAGLNTTTYPRWRNYTDQYTSVSRTDAIRKMREASTKCGFVSPLGSNVSSYNTGNDFGYYVPYSVLSTMEEILESQNSNLGSDLNSMAGRTMFRQNPVVWVPQLDSKTGSPIYGINWGVFKFVFLAGDMMRETTISAKHGQHNVSETHIDCTVQVECRDRRRNFLLATANPA